MTLFSKLADERFLEYRRRSTSAAGMAGAVVVAGLFEYRLLFHHVWSWDLLAALLVMVAVKLGLMAWYFLTK
jgi:hypothetical protein